MIANWIAILAGIWVIISAYVFSGSALKVDLWITGVIIVVLGIWGASGKERIS